MLAWSPDSQQIAFTRNFDDNYDIWVIDVSGNNERNLTDSTEKEEYPAWSPDGNWLAFSRFIPDAEIFVMTIDGDHLTNITKHPNNDSAPIWLPPRE